MCKSGTANIWVLFGNYNADCTTHSQIGIDSNTKDRAQYPDHQDLQENKTTRSMETELTAPLLHDEMWHFVLRCPVREQAQGLHGCLREIQLSMSK